MAHVDGHGSDGDDVKRRGAVDGAGERHAEGCKGDTKGIPSKKYKRSSSGTWDNLRSLPNKKQARSEKFSSLSQIMDTGGSETRQASWMSAMELCIPVHVYCLRASRRQTPKLHLPTCTLSDFHALRKIDSCEHQMEPRDQLEGGCHEFGTCKDSTRVRGRRSACISHCSSQTKIDVITRGGAWNYEASLA